MEVYVPRVERSAAAPRTRLEGQPLLATRLKPRVFVYKIETGVDGSFEFTVGQRAPEDNAWWLDVLAPVPLSNLPMFYSEVELVALDPETTDTTSDVYEFTNNGSLVVYKPGHCSQEFRFNIKHLNRARLRVSHNDEHVACRNFLTLRSTCRLTFFK